MWRHRRPLFGELQRWWEATRWRCLYNITKQTALTKDFSNKDLSSAHSLFHLFFKWTCSTCLGGWDRTEIDRKSLPIYHFLFPPGDIIHQAVSRPSPLCPHLISSSSVFRSCDGRNIETLVQCPQGPWELNKHMRELSNTAPSFSQKTSGKLYSKRLKICSVVMCLWDNSMRVMRWLHLSVWRIYSGVFLKFKNRFFF